MKGDAENDDGDHPDHCDESADHLQDAAQSLLYRMHHAVRRTRRERGICRIDRLCHPLGRKAIRRPYHHGRDRILRRHALKYIKTALRRICHHRADRLHIRIDRRIHPRSRRCESPHDAAGQIVERQHPVRRDRDAAADENIAIADRTAIALADPRLDGLIRGRVKADQLHCHRAAARMCRGKEELRRRVRHPRHAAQIGEIVLLHIELRRNALHKDPLQ